MLIVNFFFYNLFRKQYNYLFSIWALILTGASNAIKINLPQLKSVAKYYLGTFPINLLISPSIPLFL